MALVVFRSKAAGEIFMFAETAQRVFDIIGKPTAPRGVIAAEHVPQALQRLSAAVNEETAQLKAQAEKQAQEAKQAEHRGEDANQPHAITLRQRAFPLIEMLRAAQKKNVDVTWGV